jgi:dethiobiotin synthase
MRPSSIGQDTRFSSWQEEFDSPWARHFTFLKKSLINPNFLLFFFNKSNRSSKKGNAMKNGIENRLFVAATRQNDGKTTCTLGFAHEFHKFAKSVGYIKPVGQRYIIAENQKVDEDSLLIQKACALNCSLKDISPIAIEKYFTRHYIDNPEKYKLKLKQTIQNAYNIVAKDNDMIIIEGTGHAGVGSVFDLSNAVVAKMLNAKVIIVTVGGIGRPIDETMLNIGLFKQHGVEVLGVIANKVRHDKLDQTRHYLSRALSRNNLQLFGVIPYTPRLTWPTVRTVAERLNAKILNGNKNLNNVIADVVIGAMTPHNALSYLKNNSLMIVPGDRDDNVLAALTVELLREDKSLAGIVLTGEMDLEKSTLDLLNRTDLPVLAVKTPTYTTASVVHEITVKIRKNDNKKIKLAIDLVSKHIDLAKLWDALNS